MPRNALKDSIEELRNEVDSSITSQSETSLVDIRRKLDALIAQIDETEDVKLREGISGVQSSVSELEVSHPKITSALNQVMHLLSSMGI